MHSPERPLNLALHKMAQVENMCPFPVSAVQRKSDERLKGKMSSVPANKSDPHSRTVLSVEQVQNLKSFAIFRKKGKTRIRVYSSIPHKICPAFVSAWHKSKAADLRWNRHQVNVA